MGEKQSRPFQFSFNSSLKVDYQGSRITSDADLLVVRQLDERLGLSQLISDNLTDIVLVAQHDRAILSQPDPKTGSDAATFGTSNSSSWRSEATSMSTFKIQSPSSGQPRLPTSSKK
jgi:hypothetical protein